MLLRWAIGGMIGCILADYVGRRRMLMVVIAGYSKLDRLHGLESCPETLILLRFLTDFSGSEMEHRRCPGG